MNCNPGKETRQIAADFQPSSLTNGVMPSGKVVARLGDALVAIDELIRESRSVKQTFKTGWKTTLCTYENDLKEIERTLAKHPASYEEYFLMQQDAKNLRRFRKKRPKENGNKFVYGEGPEKNYEMNMSRQRKVIIGGGKSRRDTDVPFLLPDYDVGTLYGASLKADVRNDPSQVDASTIASIRPVWMRNAEQIRYQSREIMFERLDEMREKELQLMGHLFSEVTSGITDRDRRKLIAALDRCRSQNAKEVIAIVSKYRPRLQQFRPDKGEGGTFDTKMERLGLNIPSLEETMQEIRAEISAEQQAKSGESQEEHGNHETNDSLKEKFLGCGETNRCNGYNNCSLTLHNNTRSLVDNELKDKGVAREMKLPTNNQTTDKGSVSPGTSTSLLGDFKARLSSEALVCEDLTRRLRRIQSIPPTMDEGYYRDSNLVEDELKKNFGGCPASASAAMINKHNMIHSHSELINLDPESSQEPIARKMTENIGAMSSEDEIHPANQSTVERGLASKKPPVDPLEEQTQKVDQYCAMRLYSQAPNSQALPQQSQSNLQESVKETEYQGKDTEGKGKDISEEDSMASKTEEEGYVSDDSDVFSRESADDEWG